MIDLPPETKRDLILSVGTHRSNRPLLPLQVAVALRTALDSGATMVELSTALQLQDATMIHRFLRLLVLPEDIQLLIGWQSDALTIPFATASEISRLISAEDQRLLARSVLEHKMSKSEVVEVVQVNRRAGKLVRQCIDEVISRRRVIERRYMLIGQIETDTLRGRLAMMSQPERDALLRSALAHAGLGEPDYGAKLGTDYFALVSGEHFHRQLISTPDGFQTSVNRAVESELQRRGRPE